MPDRPSRRDRLKNGFRGIFQSRRFSPSPTAAPTSSSEAAHPVAPDPSLLDGRAIHTELWGSTHVQTSVSIPRSLLSASGTLAGNASATVASVPIVVMSGPVSDSPVIVAKTTSMDSALDNVGALLGLIKDLSSFFEKVPFIAPVAGLLTMFVTTYKVCLSNRAYHVLIFHPGVQGNKRQTKCPSQPYYKYNPRSSRYHLADGGNNTGGSSYTSQARRRDLYKVGSMSPSSLSFSTKSLTGQINREGFRVHQVGV